MSDEAKSKLEEVRDFIRSVDPERLCTECIRSRLGVGRPQQVHPSVYFLSGAHNFIREKGLCDGCGKNVLVICAIQKTKGCGMSDEGSGKY